jgi:hypothetical protein
VRRVVARVNAVYVPVKRYEVYGRETKRIVNLLLLHAFPPGTPRLLDSSPGCSPKNFPLSAP